MSYYHVYVHWNDEMGSRWVADIDFDVGQIKEIVTAIRRGVPILPKGIRIEPDDITKFEIFKTDERAHGKSNTWEWISRHGENVTKDFIISLPRIHRAKVGKTGDASSEEPESVPTKTKVFIVHGRNVEQPLLLQKYLKDKLEIDAVMFDDLPDKSRTIIEQLEYIRDNVWYAFVIATPDDVGCLWNEVGGLGIDLASGKVDNLFDILQTRARQNVVFEFGLFMGALGRENVCCLLHKGVAKRPSDIDGILYKPFEKSVKEVFHEVADELGKNQPSRHKNISS